MSTSKTHRRGEEKNRKGRLAGRSSSYAGIPVAMSPHGELRRPKTLPDLLSGRSVSVSGLSPEIGPRLTKLLLNVTVQRSLGPVQVVMSPDSTVEDLIASALRQYEKEGRRLALPTMDPAGFDLHYSQFSLESLDRNEKLMRLGSRNFFLCCKKSETDDGEGTADASGTASTCSTEAKKGSKVSVPWLKFIDSLF